MPPHTDFVMSSLPQSPSQWRVPRAQLDGSTPAVLRFPDGQRTSANLQVVSLTGGLLSLPQPVDQGSQVKVMFLTGEGSVLGGAEMLRPVGDALQPFRFLSIATDDQRRLKTLIWQHSNQNKSEEEWIAKLRAASANREEPRPWRLKVAGAVGLLTAGLATAAYLLHFGILR
jgi:hypothetical protein